MNERIKELAEQCWDRRLDGVHFDQEKFVELIVLECIDIAFHCGDNVDYLKEHFGIKS